MTWPPARFVIEPEAVERMMRMIDLSIATAGGERVARYRCDKCGLETDWIPVRVLPAGERRVACRVCAKADVAG